MDMQIKGLTLPAGHRASLFAIKVLREATGWGLRVAKQAHDDALAGKPTDLRNLDDRCVAALRSAGWIIEDGITATHLIFDGASGSLYEAVDAADDGGDFFPIEAENYRLVYRAPGSPLTDDSIGVWVGRGAWDRYTTTVAETPREL